MIKVASKGKTLRSHNRVISELGKSYSSLEKARLLVFESPIDKDKRVEVLKLEEKQAGVNIALEVYRDAALVT